VIDFISVIEMKLQTPLLILFLTLAIPRLASAEECCAEEKSECMACLYEVTEEVYCQDPEHHNIPGCTVRSDCKYEPDPEGMYTTGECWCISDGGMTCGDNRNSTCLPDHCSWREECGQGWGDYCEDSVSTTSARPLMTSARPLMTTGANFNNETESHEGCAMSYMGKCSAFLPTDKPDNLIEEVGHIESVQVCQHICKELYPDWCTWFIYDRTTNDCKVFSGSIDSFREDCQELGYQKEPSMEHCDVVYEPEEKNACYNFREDYCRYDGSLLDTLEKIETMSKCQMACQFINGCTYFQYDKQEKICKLHTDLVATRVCDMVHGTPEPDFQTCLDDGKVPWDADHGEHGEDRSILAI